ncbi:MAG: hypothetical protein ABI317_12510 [Gaiellales bacterium]
MSASTDPGTGSRAVLHCSLVGVAPSARNLAETFHARRRPGIAGLVPAPRHPICPGDREHAERSA